MRFTPSSSRFATAGADEIVTIWDAECKPECAPKLTLGKQDHKHKDIIYQVAFRPDGERFATASAPACIPLLLRSARNIFIAVPAPAALCIGRCRYSNS